MIIVVSNYNIHRDGWNCYRRLLVYATTTDSTKSHLIFMNHRMSQLIIICWRIFLWRNKLSCYSLILVGVFRITKVVVTFYLRLRNNFQPFPANNQPSDWLTLQVNQLEAWFLAEIGWISFLYLRQKVTTSLVVPARNLQNNFAIWLRESE